MQSPGPCGLVESAPGPQPRPLEEPLNPTPPAFPHPGGPGSGQAEGEAAPGAQEAEGAGRRRLEKVGSQPACGESLICRTKWGFAAQAC